MKRITAQQRLRGLARATLAMAATGAAAMGCAGEIGLPGTSSSSSSPFNASKAVFRLEPSGTTTQPGVRPLGRDAYERAVAQLTGVRPDVSKLPEDPDRLGLTGDAESLAVRDVNHLYELFEVAHQVALGASVDSAVGCSSDPCTDGALRGFLRRAFTRPVDSTTLSRYRAVYDEARSGRTHEFAQRAVLQTALMSPFFLYRTEIGDGGEGLAPHELANKLSFALWGEPPDAELRQLGLSGDLSDPAVYEQQVDRLLSDARFRDRVTGFIFDWLGVDHFDLSVKGASADLPSGIDRSMVEEAERLIEEVLFNSDQGMTELLQTDYTFVDSKLAGHYGLSTSGSGFERVSLQDTQRRGLLSTALVLAAHGKESGRSPMQRGHFLVSDFICHTFPPDAGGAVMALPAGSEDQMFRERFAPLEEQQPCSNCHRMLNAGFAFDVFDAVGRRFDEATVGLEETYGLFEVASYEPVAFERPVEGIQKLAKHPAVGRCVTAQLFRMAQGSIPSEADAQTMAQLEERFGATQGHVVTLLRDIVLSERFTSRVAADAN